MDKTCNEFREGLLHYWEEWETIEMFLSTSTHPQTCPDCSQFVEELQTSTEQMALSREANIVEPDFHRMRMNVWHQIDKQKKKPATVRGFLRPVVLAPLFTVVVAFFIWWAVSQHPSHNTTDMNDLMYSVAMRELKPDNYPEEAIQSVMNSEMSYSIYDYFINKNDYSTVQEISSTAGDWEQISQSMAEQNM